MNDARNGTAGALRGDAIFEVATAAGDGLVVRPRPVTAAVTPGAPAPPPAPPARPVDAPPLAAPRPAAPSPIPVAPSMDDDDWDPTVAYRHRLAHGPGAAVPDAGGIGGGIGGGVDADGHLRELQDALDAGAWARADAIAGGILADDPDNAGALHGGGIAALNLGDPERACTLLERSVERHPDNPGWHHNVGVARVRAGRVRAAEASLHHALRLSPDRGDSLALLGLLLLGAGEMAEAAIQFERAFEGDDEPRHLVLLIDTVVRAGLSDRVPRILSSARRRWPSDIRVLRAGILALTALGSPGDCLTLMADWPAGGEPSAPERQVLVAAGRTAALLALGRTAEALAASRRALSLDPASADLWAEHARALRADGAAVALPALFRSILIDRVNPARHLAVSNALHDAGERVPALIHADVAFGLSDGTDTYTQALVARLRDAGRPDEAAALCRRWYADQPRHPEAAFLLAALTGTGVPARMPDAVVCWRYDRLDDPPGDRPTPDAAVEFATRAARFAVARLKRPVRLLDLGCGRGRIGTALRALAAHVTGVDRSARFVEWSRATGAYDRTVLAEAEGYLFERPARFDLIVAEGLLPFFGETPPLFHALARSLSPGGVVFITVEPLLDEPDRPWRLRATGRFQHGVEPTVAALEAAGLAVLGDETVATDDGPVLAVLAALGEGSAPPAH